MLTIIMIHYDPFSILVQIWTELTSTDMHTDMRLSAESRKHFDRVVYNVAYILSLRCQLLSPAVSG